MRLFGWKNFPLFQFFVSAGIILCIVCLGACSSCPKSRDYKGYATKPYTVRGKHYVPMSVAEAVNYSECGIASHYNETSFFGLSSGNTSIGEPVHSWHLHAAHKTLPLPCDALVTSLSTGKSVKVRINDRGPFIKGRLIDLSEEAAEKIGMKHKGLDRVRVDILSVGDGKWKVTRRTCTSQSSTTTGVPTGQSRKSSSATSGVKRMHP